MSNTVVGAAVAAAKDGWHTLVEDIDRTIQRVGGMTPTLEILRMVMKGDILPLIRDTMKNLIELRDAVYPAINAMADHLDELEERFAGLEGIASDTQLLPEDSDLILKLAGGAKLICAELLKAATGEAKMKLEEMISLADQAETMAKEKRIEDDDDLDGEDDVEGEGEGDAGNGGTQQ